MNNLSKSDTGRRIPLTQKMQGWLRKKLDGAGAGSLFYEENENKSSHPESLTTNRLNIYLYNKNVKSIPLRHWSWLKKRLQHPVELRHKPHETYQGRPYNALSISRSDLMNAVPELYDLAGQDDFEPRPFTVWGRTAGYFMPVRMLADYFKNDPTASSTTKTMVIGTKQSYEHFKKENHVLTSDKAVALLCLGLSKKEIRPLPIVSPALYKTILEFASRDKSEPSEDQTHEKTDLAILPRHSRSYRKTGEIAGLCAKDKAVMLLYIQRPQDGALMAAVPLAIAEKLKDRLFPKAGKNFIVPVSSYGFYRKIFNSESVSASESFLCVTRGRAARPGFAVIPAHLLAFLKIGENGTISGLKEAPKLHFAFNAAVALTAGGSRAEMDVLTPMHPKAAVAWEKVVGEFSLLKNGHHANGHNKNMLRHHFPETPAAISGILRPDGAVEGLTVAFKDSTMALLQMLAQNRTVHIGHREFQL